LVLSTRCLARWSKRATKSTIYRLAEWAWFLLMVVANQIRRRPRPSSSPLVSGIAPADGQNTRPLSDDQLNRLETWLRPCEQRWRRNIIPPAHPFYMVRVQHSDGTDMFVMLFLREQSNVYFHEHTKNRRF